MDISAIFLSYIMFILKSLILVISFILSLTGRCPKKPFSKGQCSSHEFLQDQEIYEVKQWKKGFRCNYLEKNKIFLQRWFNKKLPGDDCTKNSECYSNSCVNIYKGCLILITKIYGNVKLNTKQLDRYPSIIILKEIYNLSLY